MTDIQAWLNQGRALTEARTYAPFTAKPDEYGDNIVLKSGGYSLRTGDWGDNDTIQPTPNTKYVDHAIQAFPQALDALQAVLEVHAPIDALNTQYTNGRIPHVCTGCGTDDGRWNYWPCPTVRAITDAIKEQGA